MNAGLREVKQCPVCGGESRTAGDGFAPRKTAGYHYLKHAAERLSLSVAELGERIQVYRCGKCGSFYCDPWLGPELASQVFCAGAPDHIAGWRNFEQWLSSQSPNGVEARNRQLFALLRERIGEINAYAEFGCPFQGFLLPMRGAELPTPERLNVFAHALLRAPDARWSRMTRWYHAAEKILKSAVLMLFKLRAWKERMRQPAAPAPIAPVPTRRVFLTEDTTFGWGSNCVRYGGTCQYFSHAVLGADVIPLAEAMGNTSFRFDLIGIFNNLDHTAAPLDVIRKCLNLAPHVLVVTHRASHAGRQHLYAFNDDFPAWLSQALPDVRAGDLFAGTGQQALLADSNYILISKVPERER